MTNNFYNSIKITIKKDASFIFTVKENENKY